MKFQNSANRSQKGFGALAIVVVIAIVAALGGFGLYKMYKRSHTAASMENQASVQNTTANQEATPTVAGTSGSTTSPRDTSDKALDTDTANINAQINAMNSDSVNVDQSLNTTPENLAP